MKDRKMPVVMFDYIKDLTFIINHTKIKNFRSVYAQYFNIEKVLEYFEEHLEDHIEEEEMRDYIENYLLKYRITTVRYIECNSGIPY